LRPEESKDLPGVGPLSWIHAAAGSTHTMRTDAGLREAVRSAEDEEELREAAAEYLLRGTEATEDPAAALEAQKPALLAMRPDDLTFATLIDDVCAGLAGLWQSVGRTAEILGPVHAACARADWARLRALIVRQVEALCLATPTLDAVDSFRGTLLNNGPHDVPDYEEAVRGAFDDVLVEIPKHAARRLRASLDRIAPAKIAAELARITAPSTSDPLTAARIVQEACDTVIELLHPLRPASVTGSEAFPILDSIAAAVDSASRSPEIDITIGIIARSVPERLLSDMIWHSVAERGIGPTLALEKIRQIELNGDTDLAELELREALLPAVDSYYQLVREAVEDFYDLAVTLLNPLLNWTIAFAPAEREQAWSGYCAAFANEIAQLEAGLAQVGRHGYNLVRISDALRSYAPHFEAAGLCDELESRADAFIDEESPGLAVALALSDAALLEGLRAANLDGMLRAPALDALAQRLVDPGRGLTATGPIGGEHWYGLGPCLTLRRVWRSMRKNPGIDRPDWPTSPAGERLAAILGLHAAGTLTDGRETITKSGPAACSPAVLCLMRRQERGAPMARLFALHLKRDGAAMSAGALTAQIAATLLDGLDHHDRILKAMQSEPFNRRYLIEAGIAPDIATLLASNDLDGIGAAARLQAWASLTGTPFTELLQWLSRQDGEWLRAFVRNALLSIDADREGAFPLFSEGGNVELSDATLDEADGLAIDEDEIDAGEEPYRRTILVRTIAGIGEWARATGHPMPGA
jgi:hypothetical protein